MFAMHRKNWEEPQGDNIETERSTDYSLLSAEVYSTS
jgi:hypothetical protein